MSGFRKMVLVDQGEVDRLRQKQIREYNPTISAMGRTQAELEAVLNNAAISDEDKVAILQETQRRFDRLKSIIGPMSEIPVTTTMTNPAPPTAQATAQQAAAQVTPAHAAQPQAGPLSSESDEAEEEGGGDNEAATKEALIDFISKHPSLIRGSRPTGQLVIKNRRVIHSSFENLLDAAMRQPKSNLSGVDKFIEGLKSINTPAHLIPNPHIASQLSQASDSISSANPQSQTGQGKSRPPGKRPRILWLYH